MLKRIRKYFEDRRAKEHKRNLEAAFWAQQCGLSNGDVFTKDWKTFLVVVDRDETLKDYSMRRLVRVVEWVCWNGQWLPQDNMKTVAAGDLQDQGGYTLCIPELSEKVSLEFVFPGGSKKKSPYHPGDERSLLFDLSAFHLAMYSSNKSGVPIRAISSDGKSAHIAPLEAMQINSSIAATALEMDRE